MPPALSPRLALAAVLLLGPLLGCATPPPASDPDAVAEFNEAHDPLEPTNRVLYSINNGIDTVILRPAALAYRAALPPTGAAIGIPEVPVVLLRFWRWNAFNPKRIESLTQ